MAALRGVIDVDRLRAIMDSDSDDEGLDVEQFWRENKGGKASKSGKSGKGKAKAKAKTKAKAKASTTNKSKDAQWTNPSKDHLQFDEDDGEGGDAENRPGAGLDSSPTVASMGRRSKAAGTSSKAAEVGPYKSRLPRSVTESVFGTSMPESARKRAKAKARGKAKSRKRKRERSSHGDPERPSWLAKRRPTLDEYQRPEAKLLQQQEYERQERQAERREYRKRQKELDERLRNITYDDAYTDDAFHAMVNPEAQVFYNNEMIKAQVAVSSDMVDHRDVESDGVVWKQATVFKLPDYRGFFSGEITLPGGVTKPPLATKRDVVMFLVRGSVYFTIGGSTFTLTRGSHMLIPCGNAYSIKNASSDRAAHLIFTSVEVRR